MSDIKNVRSFLFEFKDGTELKLVEKENYDKLVERIKELEEKLLELLSYLTSDDNMSTEMKSAIEYQNKRFTDILHAREVEHLKKYIEYLRGKIDEYKKKNKDLSNQILMLYKEQDNNAARIDKKNAEIEKYKYLYQKALDNTIEADRENIQLKKQIDLMAERIEWLCKSNGILLDKEHDENFTQEDIKKHFERKVNE